METTQAYGVLPVSKRLPQISIAEAESLLLQCDQELESFETDRDIALARELAAQAGLNATSDLSTRVGGGQAATSTLTAGYCNTNHTVVCTGDYVTDRVAELRRQLITRVRAEQPEAKGEERWDKPRVPGERRRRIVRDKDAPCAPHEPPSSGYVVFVGQMTTKIRHDRPHQQHDQSKVVQEISKIWKHVLMDEEKYYYNSFAADVKNEYKEQNMEFRATGVYTPSERFVRVEGTGLWLKKKPEEKNELEKEIDGYETVIFPPRPIEFDEDHKRREEESKRRRKLRLKKLRNGEEGSDQSAKKLKVAVTTMASV